MIAPSAFEENFNELIRRWLRQVPLPPGDSAPEAGVEAPRQKGHGDLAVTVALSLGSRLKKPPLELAQSLAKVLEEGMKGSALAGTVERVEVKPPGFVNLFLSRPFLQSVLREVLSRGSEYGRGGLGRGKRVMVEFVSANPTGPLSVAHGRQAAVGDALANLLQFAGHPVHREYYLNDEGTQIDLLGESILARAREKAGLPFTFPENGYKGAYIADCGAQLLQRAGAQALEGPQAKERARRFGVEELTDVIRGDLDTFGVHFDRWFPQSALDRWGYLRRTLEILKRRGHLYEQEGAWWLKSTAFGDDKDRVVIRSDGRLTYIAADIAYHRRKLRRGFRLLVNLWGPDHHGYIPRLKAAVQALGYPAQALQIRIVQLCTLKRGKETIPMSTREGQFITLKQVMEEVGRDAARFFFLLRKTDAHLEFDLELAKQQTSENPVYYIQYAHARIASLLRKAREEKLKPGRGSAADHSRLTAPEELNLLRQMRAFPGVVAACARSLEPFGMTVYLQELAEAFHRFYDAHRVIGSEPLVAQARLDLAEGARAVLANGLRLLGVAAPETM